MNAIATSCEIDKLGYGFVSRQRTAPLSDRVGRTAVRNLAGQQRAAHQARYSRRVARTNIRYLTSPKQSMQQLATPNETPYTTNAHKNHTDHGVPALKPRWPQD